MNATSEEMFQHAANLQREGKAIEARGYYQKIIEQEPTHFGALLKLAEFSAQHDKNPTLALRLIDSAIGSHPDNTDGHINRGFLLLNLGRGTEALDSFERAVALTSVFYTHLFRGKALTALGRHEEALAAYDRSVSLNPTSEAYHNRAISCLGLRRYAEAVANCNEAISSQPDLVSAYIVRGLAHDKLGQSQKALASFDKALELEPGSALAHRNRGVTLETLKRYPEAIIAFANAMQLAPDLDQVPGACMSLVMQLCDWRDYDQNLELIIDQVEADGLPCQPLALLRLPSTPSQQQRLAAKYFSHVTRGTEPIPLAPHRRGAKLRIGYFSADFGEHAVGNSLVGVFEAHDKARFETAAFLIDARKEDAIQVRIRNAVNRFIDVSGKADIEIVHLAREMEIDIAVDLMGPTQGCRPAIYLMRAAPIQVNFFGYPGTMGTDAIDYIFADEIVIPRHYRKFYNESICRLPHSYQANDSKRPIPDAIPSRNNMGLPDGSFVFCCFNSSFKITPDAFQSWMRILANVPKSVLWLYVNDHLARENLRAEATDHNISPDRLIFAERISIREHLARQSLADLFLDTFHYGAHVTATDALWVGLPVLTRLGDSFPSRVGASLLTALGLPELIATTTEDYENKAIALASNPDKIAAIKKRLQEKRLTSPLFDTARFTRNLEAAYLEIADIHFAGRAPTDISISDLPARSY